MATNTIINNTANTLSVFSSPGQDKRFPITSSQSVFTFGDFQIDRGTALDNLQQATSAVSFSNFSTLNNFTSNTVSAIQVYGTSENELNPDVTDPNSYSYFGSFYTKVSRGINELINGFPYAILANTNGSANTVFGFTSNPPANTSQFNIPTSALTNQGSVIFASGITDPNVITIFKDYAAFAIQFSGTGNTYIYDIIDYAYTTGTTGYMQFTINGLLFTGATTSTNLPIYIRPNAHRYSQYQRTISNLEYQLAFDGTFKVPDVDDETLFSYQQYVWPRTIDGFNIDTYGSAYDDYITSALTMAQRVDEVKTSWMVRTMIPEQFIELDTDTQIYQKLTSVYAEEFDDIKAYIDNLSYMHSVTYDRLESVPDKFMYKLSRLLGFDYHDAFSEVDMFEYFLSEDQDGKTLQDYNLEMWRKILSNIVWLYKKKGTRDSLMFIFKLMGAPDSLITLNEFIYKINKTNYHNANPVDPLITENTSLTTNKIDTDGYINYNASEFVFQEGGMGRGNGQNYINQWHPEFEPLRYVDNIKIQTGDTDTGTRDTMNSKELQVSLDPAGAIEADVFEWYRLGFGMWNWGSTGTTYVSPFNPIGPLPFSGLTVPFEWIPDPDSIMQVIPPSILTMTMAQWIDYVYMSNVDPRDRKTSQAYSPTMSEYISLKKIYISYMYWTNGQNSNRLTFQKLEHLIDLLERNFFNYLGDFIPATAVLETTATVYRNTVFERQKFVYPAGINSGSEFQIKLPDELDEVLPGFVMNSSVNNNIQPTIDAISLQNQVVNNLVSTNQAFSILSDTKPPISPINYSFSMIGNFFPEIEMDFTTSNLYSSTTINYTSGNTLVPFYGTEPVTVSNSFLGTLNIGSSAIDNIL